MLCVELVLFACLAALACASAMGGAEPEGKQVVVKVGEREGPANLEHLLGVCMYGPEPDTSHPWHKAWKSIGLKHVRGPGLDGDRRVTLAGGSASEVELDFSGLDATMRVFREMGAENLFSIFGVPQHLSSNPGADKPNEDHYSQYAPTDYALWERHIEAGVRHMVERWGCKGAWYEVWNEPEDYVWYWKGRPGSDDVLRDYIELYVHTARAITRVDPTAKVGGPATAHWDSAAGGAHTWGLPQFLRAFAEYRKAHPGENVPLDFIAWHDYTWISHCPNLLDGVAFVDRVLDGLGWKDRPEYWITEWNLGFAQWAEKHSPQEFASHVGFNLIVQSNARSRRLSRMCFYVFDSDDNPKTPLISGYARRGGPTQQSGEILLQPSGAVFQMLNQLNQGELVSCEASSPLVAVATRTGDRIRVMVNNNTPEPCEIKLLVEGIGKAKRKLPCQVQRVDEKHSSDGRGLEEGESLPLQTIGGAAELSLTLPAHSTVMAGLTTAKK